MFAVILHGYTQRTTRREMSLARRERMRTNSGPYLNSASSSAITSPRNRGASASAPQSGGKLNRRQSFAAAACAESSIDDNHGVHGLLRSQALSDTNQSPQKWKQFKRKAFEVIDGVRYTTGQAQAISNCVGLGLCNGVGGLNALLWPDLHTNQTAKILAIMVRS